MEWYQQKIEAWLCWFWISIFLIMFVVLQEEEAVGSSILQLLVSDRDTPLNGPPFTFHIVSGNEGRHFHVDQGGLLSLSSSLRKREKSQHVLKIQVLRLNFKLILMYPNLKKNLSS